MANLIDAKIQELVDCYGYNEHVLREFVEFVQTQPKPRKKKTSTSSKKPTEPKPLTKPQLETGVATAFGCKDVKELKKHQAFKLAIAGRELNLSRKDAWLVLYREWVSVPANEQHEEGPTCINGIDVLKNFRPWIVFDLDSKTATADDITTAFRHLTKQHHPDYGGDRQVFERLVTMRDSLLAFR